MQGNDATLRLFERAMDHIGIRLQRTARLRSPFDSRLVLKAIRGPTSGTVHRTIKDMNAILGKYWQGIFGKRFEVFPEVEAHNHLLEEKPLHKAEFARGRRCQDEHIIFGGGELPKPSWK